ncbi:hypothetical protein DFP74_5470 [Nocardiopsis sp. Huas11]|nr:hypothetical protein DFP74_5470 [Nocardiopsis sp. Huas11]
MGDSWKNNRLVLDIQEMIALHRKGGIPQLNERIFITSTTARELFFLKDRGSAKYNYWIPEPHISESLLGEGGMVALRYFREAYARRSRQDRDRVHFYFGTDYPPVIESGHRSVAFLVNANASRVIKECAKPLGRERRRIVKSRIDFLSAASVECIPLVDRSAGLALPLFHEFAKRYTLKADFQNSLNDILVLALSQYHSLPMKTRDKVLADFAQEVLGAAIELNSSALKISPRNLGGDRSRFFESKGYINKGWRVSRSWR